MDGETESAFASEPTDEPTRRVWEGAPMSAANLFLTPFFLGLAPILGKFAIGAGADPFSIAAIRTVIAAGLLWALYALFARRYITIYPAGLLGCIIVGAINGIGSLFYYSGLGLLDASLVQLINGMYIAFALLLVRAGGEKTDRRVVLRVALAVAAIACIAGLGGGQISGLGVGLMIGSALMFAGTFVLSQYVLYDMPSATATLYILSTMAVVVLIVWGAVGSPLPSGVLADAFPAITALGITTALSRLAMFASVQRFGSIRTAVNAAGEIGVALVLAFFLLGDRLNPAQLVGVILLIASIALVRAKDLQPRSINLNSWLIRDVASLQFQRIAFHRAFGKPDQDNAAHSMSSVTTEELRAIMRMMGARDHVDPLPLPRGVETEAETIPVQTGEPNAERVR